MPRVLLLHASVGTGHKRAAEALSSAFTRRQPGEVRVEDVLDHTSTIFRIAYARSYLELTDHAPLVWGYFYTQTNADPDLAEITSNVRKLVEGIGTNGLKEVLKNFQPDIIICTHFLPMELLLRLKRQARLNQPIYCVITDHAAHTFWTYTELDGYFVADDQTRAQLIERGVPAANIQVTGIPIDPSFAEPKESAAARARLNLPSSGSVITLFGGGVTNERIRIIAVGLLASGAQASLVVVAGRNATLVEALADLQASPTMQLQVLGYITYVDDLIAASDLIVTKAGGLIVSEVLARGVPLVVIDPIPGQEEWNADYVVATGAGVQLRMAESVPATVVRLLEQPMLLKAMHESAVSSGHPRAALEIAERVIAEFASKKHT